MFGLLKARSNDNTYACHQKCGAALKFQLIKMNLLKFFNLPEHNSLVEIKRIFN